MSSGSITRAIVPSLIVLVIGTEVAEASTPGAALGPGAWTMLPLLPSRRQEVGTAIIDGKIYVVGGFDGSGRSVNTVERYDIAAGRWEPVPDLPAPLPLNHVAAAGVDGVLYVIGGLTQNFAAVDTVFAFDPATNMWTTRAPMPLPRGAMGVGVIDGKIITAGGLPSTRSRVCASYDPSTNSWTNHAPMPTGRDHLAAAVVGGEFYAISGRRGPNLLAVEVFDPVAGAWSRRAPIPTARAGIAAAALDGIIYVFGGEGNPASPLGIFDEVEAYDAALDHWRAMPGMPLARHGMGAVESGGVIYLPGGATIAGFGAVDHFDAYTPDPWCYADCDTTTGWCTLDIFDFLCFQNSFVLGEPYARDCDPDPVCDIFDFLCFQNAFVGGCP